MAEEQRVLRLVVGKNGKKCIMEAPTEEKVKKQAEEEFGKDGIASMTPVSTLAEGLSKL